MSIGASAADRRSATGVRIWLFGDFRVEVDGSVVPPGAWSRSKARALVKVLALAHAHRRHREQLMDELWPALGPTAAAANLRKAIHFARRAVGAEHIVVRHELVELAGSDVWVDVDAFETARRAGDAATAVALYADDLLTEDRYEPWAEERREQLRREFAEVLLEFGRERERRGDWRGAVHVFERLAAVDPLHEDAYCGLLRIHAAQGQRHLALRWYRQLEDRLREEWGTAPGAGVRRLRDAIVADDEGGDETENESDGRAALGAETGPRASARAQG